MEGRTMKRTMVMISIVVTVLTTAVLHGGYGNTDTQKTTTLEEAYNAGFPAELPDVVTQPTTGTAIL